MSILLFNKWDLSEVKTSDLGLQRYLNVQPIIVPRSGGRFGKKSVHKVKVNVIERFMNKLMVPGHAGKRHKITSGQCCGNSQTIYLAMKRALEIIEEKTKSNPVLVFVKAVENAAILEEVASYRLGGIIARKAVIVSPQRRLDLALRHLSQGIYRSTFRNKKPLSESIAEGIMAAANNDPKCFAISERIRIEKEAEGAR